MREFFASFFADARSAHLTQEERAASRNVIADFMASRQHAVQRRNRILEKVLLAQQRRALHAEERGALRSRVYAFLGRGMPSADQDSFSANFLQGLSDIAHTLSMRRLPVALASLLLFVIAGKVVVYASESALPGDALYPVKIHVAEHPWLNFRFAQTARAEWEVTLAERRLEEAETLAATGQLTDELHRALSDRFAAHAGRARGIRSVADAFDDTIHAHELLLRSLAKEQGEKEVQMQVLLDYIDQAKHDADAPADSIAATEAERQVTAAARRVEQVRIYVLEKRQLVEAETMKDAQARLTAASYQLAQAQAKLDGGSLSDAYQLARKANLLAQEAKLLVRAEGELKVELE